jgi:protein TonB
MVSLLLHGLVAAVTLGRSLGLSPQPATVYEVVLASGTLQTAAKPERSPRSTARTVAVQALPAPVAPIRPVSQPALPPAHTASLPPVAVQLPAVTTAAGADVTPSASVTNTGRHQAVLDADDGSPLLQLGSSGAPAFSRQVAPVYPAQARRLGREGTVVLKLAIDAEGRLQGVEVVQPAAFGFTEAALTAIRQSSYRPAVRAGRPVQAQALITVRFTLRS